MNAKIVSKQFNRENVNKCDSKYLQVLPVLFVLACAAYTNAGRIFLLDDGFEGKRSGFTSALVFSSKFLDEPLMRVRRATGYGYAPPTPVPSYYAPAKGRVGPRYTFSKTDPQANFKWGVGHMAGFQYGR